MRMRSCNAEVVAVLVGLITTIASATAQIVPDIPPVHGVGGVLQNENLQLEVFMNGAPSKLIGSFHKLPDGSLTATPKEVSAIGLKPVKNAIGADGQVHLGRLPGVAYRVDERTQAIWITATDGARLPRVIDVQPHEEAGKPQTGYGAVLNYSLFGATDGALFRGFDGLSAAVDGRIFSPYGTLSQSMVTSTASNELGGLTRLDTTYSYSDVDSLITYRAGDVISGGLSWTRPVRLGGFQAQRNFALRPDLVTLPIPVVSGSAAVPSTLEIYTQNVRTFTSNIPAGPYEIVNLPIVTGAGTARVVLRDALGRETVTTLPYFASNELLRKGLYSFSIESGFARRFYGIESNNYNRDLMGSASARYGLSNWLTLEGHAEGGGGLLNGGAGAVFSVGTIGVASLAIAGSHFGGRTGALLNASLQMSLLGISLYARTQRTLGDYEDIASVTAADDLLTSYASNASYVFNYPLPFFDVRVPKSLDQLSLGVPLPFDRSSVSLSYTQTTTAAGERNRIASVSYSRNIFRNSTFFATAFKDLDDKDSFGVFAGISVPLSDSVTATTSVESDPTGTRVVAEAMKSEQRENGSYGWRIRDAEGADPDHYAAASYRSSVGRIEGTVEQYAGDTRATAQFDGSVVFAGGGFFFGNRIDDAFAVVDTGVPNVAVQYENRPIGKTDSQGLLLVPYLHSYLKNKITIDPKNLPVDADVPSVRQTVVPADRSGVVVKFDVSETPHAALVTFVDGAGKPLEVSSQGQIEGSDQTFIVGYDGEAYIHGLKANNVVSISSPRGNVCHAKFAYAPRPGEQVSIKDVVCQ